MCKLVTISLQIVKFWWTKSMISWIYKCQYQIISNIAKVSWAKVFEPLPTILHLTLLIWVPKHLYAKAYVKAN